LRSAAAKKQLIGSRPDLARVINIAPSQACWASCRLKWEKKRPGRVENIFSSLSTVVPSHLMDRDLFGFTDIKADGVANPLGDIAFDEEPCSTPASNTISLQRR